MHYLQLECAFRQPKKKFPKKLQTIQTQEDSNQITPGNQCVVAVCQVGCRICAKRVSFIFRAQWTWKLNGIKNDKVHISERYGSHTVFPCCVTPAPAAYLHPTSITFVEEQIYLHLSLSVRKRGNWSDMVSSVTEHVRLYHVAASIQG